MKLVNIVRKVTAVVLIAIVVTIVVPPVSGKDGMVENNDQGEAQQSEATEPSNNIVHSFNAGEREYLSPNLIAIQNMAMFYLPLSMNLINVIDAYREVVNGVRYEILLNAIDTKANDTEIICQLVILEKPWLRTLWGDKVRELLYSNCSSGEENNNKSNAFEDGKYESNSLFNGRTRNELTSDEMNKLVSQIIPTKSDITTTPPTTTTSTAATKMTTMMTPGNNEDFATTISSRHDEEMNTESKELTDDEKKWIDDIFSVGAFNFEQSLLQNSKNEPIFVDASGSNSEGENYHAHVVEQQQHEAYNNQQQLQQQQQERQQEQQLHQVALECNQQKLEEDKEEVESRQTRANQDNNPIVGGSSKLEESEAKSRLQKTLEKLSSGEGPNYKIDKIHSATTQVVSGSLTKIDADLIDADEKKIRCNIEIWSQPWLPNGNEVTIKCPGKDTLKRRHERSVDDDYLEKKTHKKQAAIGYDKTEHLFNKFQVKYNKQYHSSSEHQMRLRIFRNNLKKIEELNRNEMGSAKYGITEFADLTVDEYKQRTGLLQRAVDQPSKNTLAEIPNVSLPEEFDWREKGVVSKVKNQGNCGSCWAFSVTGNIESLHAIKTGNLEEYSEQELLDCDTIDSACQGGLPDDAYKAIQEIGGLELESQYPYEARKKECHFDKTLSRIRIKGAVDLPKNETAIAQWLITNGPISIGINANAMQFYRGGVSHPWRLLCSPGNLDHGVLIVGYGVSKYPMFKKILPYWIIKNSWGPRWGEQGYYRVYRGTNTCGVGEMATSAILV